MKKIILAMVIMAMFSCTKQDLPQIEAAKANKNLLYLSEVYRSGKLSQKHYYENGKLVKTRNYTNGLSVPFYETIYTYDPAERSVTINDGGFVYVLYYDSRNRPIRQEITKYWVHEYFYDGDRMSRILITMRNNEGPVATEEFLYTYAGQWLQGVTETSTRYYPEGNTTMTSEYVAKWSSPFSYAYYPLQYPEQSSSYRFSTSVKAPDYNLNITPDGLANDRNISRRSLLRQNSRAFLAPEHGMLRTFYASALTYTSYIENIVTNKDNMPVSYEEVTEQMVNGTKVTGREKFEFKYIIPN